jgi:hypothetical protein
VWLQLNMRKLRQEAVKDNPAINFVCQKVGTEGMTCFEDRQRPPLGISVNFNSYSAKMLAQVGRAAWGSAHVQQGRCCWRLFGPHTLMLSEFCTVLCWPVLQLGCQPLMMDSVTRLGEDAVVTIAESSKYAAVGEALSFWQLVVSTQAPLVQLVVVAAAAVTRQVPDGLAVVCIGVSAHAGPGSDHWRWAAGVLRDTC